MRSEFIAGAVQGALCPKCTQDAACSRESPEDTGESRSQAPKARVIIEINWRQLLE